MGAPLKAGQPRAGMGRKANPRTGATVWGFFFSGPACLSHPKEKQMPEAIVTATPAATAGTTTPATSAPAGGTATAQVPPAPATTPPSQPAQPDPLPAPVRQIVEETLKRERETLRREMQSEKDKAIAEIRKTLGVPTPSAAQTAMPTAQPQAMQAPQDGLLTPDEEKQFIALADSDFAGAMRFRDKVLTQRVTGQALNTFRAEMQQQEEQNRAAQQYEANFEHLAQASGLTQQERERAIDAVREAFQSGQPITPYEAAMIGRFGSLQASLQFATQGLGQQAAPAGATPPQSQGQQAPPSIPGGSRGTVPQPQPTGQQPQTGAGSFRTLFRR